jgi:hypothetical protein
MPWVPVTGVAEATHAAPGVSTPTATTAQKIVNLRWKIIDERR